MTGRRAYRFTDKDFAGQPIAVSFASQAEYDSWWKELRRRQRIRDAHLAATPHREVAHYNGTRKRDAQKTGKRIVLFI